ncbi:hypothetical protein Tco_1185167 [Tanacetum coccineum]
MEKKDTLSSCSDSEIQQMQLIQDKSKESCMVSFQRLHSHLKCLLNNDLKGSRTEDGFKRAFTTLFCQDLETFTGTMFLNMDQLQKQLDNNEFQEIGSMASFKVLETQFQMFIKSKIYLNDEYIVMTRNYFLEYTRLDIPEFRDTLIQNMDYVKKSIEKRALHKMEYDSRVNERQLQIQQCKVQEVQSSVTSSGDETSSGIVSDEEIEKKELEAHYGFMAKIQEVLPAESSSIDTPLEQVQNHDASNVFANERRHSEQPESINDTYVLEKDDSNVTPDSSNICNNDNQVDQNAAECVDERAALANLIANLTLDTEENKTILKQLKKANASLTQELKECRTNLDETGRALGEATSCRDSCLIALQNKQNEFEKYKAFNDRTIDYDILQTKLNETLGLLARKDIDIKEGLKTKAYEISVVNQKHDELVKKSLLTKSQFEGQLKEKSKVISDLKVKEGRDIDKMIEMDKQIKFLNEILYKRNQSIQTIHMLAPDSAQQIMVDQPLANHREESRVTAWEGKRDLKAQMQDKNKHIRGNSLTSVADHSLKSIKLQIRSANNSQMKFTKGSRNPIDFYIASDTTIQKPKSYFKELYENTNKAWKWWIEKKCPSEYKWTQTTPSRPSLKWKPTGRIFSNVRLRWIPIGKLLNSCTGKVESESTHGSNVDIPHIHACKQTLGLSAGTSFNGQKQQRIDLNADALYNVKQENLRVCSGLVLHQMTSDHNRSELGILVHSNEQSSSKLVPKVVP